MMMVAGADGGEAPGYWDDFHACTLTALTDCQEGATDLWEKLRRESKNLDFQGSLFELCGGGSGAAPSLLPPALGKRTVMEGRKQAGKGRAKGRDVSERPEERRNAAITDL
nr:PREDICTED: neuritin [Opisthocomus hoazin]